MTQEEILGHSEKRIMSSVFTLLVATLARRGGVRAMGQTIPAIRNEVTYETFAQANTCSEPRPVTRADGRGLFAEREDRACSQNQ